MNNGQCECENKDHFDDYVPGIERQDGDPFTAPGHPYGITPVAVEAVLTDYGTFSMCADCRSSRHGVVASTPTPAEVRS